MPKREWITIKTTDSGFLSLFSVEERSNGDIQLFLPASRIRSPGKFIEDQSEDPLHGQMTQMSKFSIHQSNESVNKINAIKYSLISEEDDRFSSENYTKAIKRDGGFSFVFARRASEMADDVYKSNINVPGIIHLGDWNRRLFTVHYSVFFGPAGCPFSSTGSPSLDINAAAIDIGRFRIGVLWSFCSIPSDGSSFMFIGRTFKQNPEFCSSGKNFSQCIELFNHLGEEFLREHRALIWPILKNEPKPWLIFRCARHFKEGVETDAYHDFCAWLVWALDTLGIEKISAKELASISLSNPCPSDVSK